MEQTTRVVLFDLDGTINDSAKGMINGFRYAFGELGVPIADDHDWTPFLGPPLRDALQDLLGLPEEAADRGVAAYLEYYRDGGKYENEVFPGIPELLTRLVDHDVPLAVATSKRQFMAEEILEHFGLRGYFAAVGGADPDGTNGRKHEVIDRTLDELGVDRGDKRGIVMIGDREHDIHGAKIVGLETVGVRWGYAVPGELEAAGADHVVDTVDELGALLLD